MQPNRTYLALDPGTTGALALVNGRSISVFDVPTVAGTAADGGVRTRLDLEALADLCRTLALYDPILVTEAVAGRQGDNPFSVGELTRAAGAVEAALAVAGVSVAYRVQPAAWKRALGLTRIPKADRKKASLELARSLWPSCPSFARVKDHNRAEAALIAHWAACNWVVAGTSRPAPRPKPKRRRKSKSTKNVFC